MVNFGLDDAIADMGPVEFALADGTRVCMRVEEASINYPSAPLGLVGIRNQHIYPSECRQRAATYKGKMNIKISWTVNGGPKNFIDKDMGDVPIMIKVCINL